MTQPLEISIFPLGEGMAFDEAREIWREAERLGFPAIWHEDNVFPHPTELLDRRTPILDCWTALSALAASTSTIRLGSMVSPAPRRHPALLARAASTVDHVSNGRLTIGIGAGDPTTVQHYTQWGLPFPETPRERVALLREHLQVQKLLYTEDVSNFDGEYFSLHDAVNSPKPLQRPHPPIWIGLNTSAVVMPRVAAELADGIIVEWGDDEVAAQVVPRLVEACERRDRDPDHQAVREGGAGEPDRRLGDDRHHCRRQPREGTGHPPRSPCVTNTHDSPISRKKLGSTNAMPATSPPRIRWRSHPM